MTGVTLKRARLLVADEIAPLVELPAGFRQVWERPAGQEHVTELLIEGPFPDVVEDCSMVSVQIELKAGPPPAVFWTWVDFRTNQPLTAPVQV